MAGRTPRPRSVWIVLDESDEAPELVLAVFASRDEAMVFSDSLDSAEYGGAALGEYRFGYTVNGQRYAR